MEELDDIRWDWEEDGRLVRRELERKTFARGGWATVMFLFQELELETDAWQPPKVAIVRFQKVRGLWKKHAAWNLAGADEAHAVAATLGAWFAPATSS
jgi:hypothetical protein